MAPRLIQEGKIQILGQTLNSVVYSVSSDSKTGFAADSPSVLKGGTVWYEGREALGPGKSAEESDERARKEASIYDVLGHHDRILGYLGLEVAVISEGAAPKAWAVRLERAPYGALRDYIVNNKANPPDERTRLQLAMQFAEGVAHIHRRGVVWGDLSTRNALLFDDWCIKLGDFAHSDLVENYPEDWYMCETRYCPPGSDRPHRNTVGTMNREIFALGTAIYEIVEWKVPYGPVTEVSEDEVTTALADGNWPQLNTGNPAEAIIRGCWEYKYESSQRVLDDLRCLGKDTTRHNLNVVEN
ncbi:hypothetical protein PRK78_001854 [Emydomyces testavorans]|uniref:Protein kinase domain-containing protein n=1 Tax=Emydomyces testavorans TaxID=2070801 RepID=A0AAF0IH98_9EURO|nr:hypothetical protein PRK78_001854 [Emydomyces testavorans]